MRRYLLIPLSLLIALMACGGTDTPTSRTGRLDGEWTLISGRGPEGEVSVPPRAQVTFEVADAFMRGTAACNSYEGPLRVDGSSIDASRIGATEMACGVARMRTEHGYFAALGAVETYRRSSDELTLLGDDTELNFERVPTPPPPPLEETDWQLNGLIEGGLSGEPRPGSLLFHTDGTFEADTGCREVTGRWQDTGGHIETSNVRLGPGRCRGYRAEQDRHVVEVLESEFTAKINEQLLELDSLSSELGLFYKAR